MNYIILALALLLAVAGFDIHSLKKDITKLEKEKTSLVQDKGELEQAKSTFKTEIADRDKVIEDRNKERQDLEKTNKQRATDALTAQNNATILTRKNEALSRQLLNPPIKFTGDVCKDTGNLFDFYIDKRTENEKNPVTIK